jgi:hypothetical protein
MPVVTRGMIRRRPAVIRKGRRIIAKHRQNLRDKKVIAAIKRASAEYKKQRRLLK